MSKDKHNRYCLCDKCVDKSSSPRAVRKIQIGDQEFKVPEHVRVWPSPANESPGPDILAVDHETAIAIAMNHDEKTESVDPQSKGPTIKELQEKGVLTRYEVRMPDFAPPHENKCVTGAKDLAVAEARTFAAMSTPTVNRNLVFPEEALTREVKELGEKTRVLENQIRQMRNCGNCEGSIAACRERRVPGGLSRYEECMKHDRIHWVWDGKQHYTRSEK